MRLGGEIKGLAETLPTIDKRQCFEPPPIINMKKFQFILQIYKKNITNANLCEEMFVFLNHFVYLCMYEEH